jgi:DNA-directed RNA polymerase subunit RPC12/RpoP
MCTLSLTKNQNEFPAKCPMCGENKFMKVRFAGAPGINLKEKRMTLELVKL